ncbi:MAG: hypothetical protein IJI75_13820 [Solobacterium sp.]|nr:hypothetical protein [Solobacterium sp.]
MSNNKMTILIKSILLSTIVFFTGCSRLTDQIQNEVIEKSQIEETDTFREYQKRIGDTEERTAPIRVTFASNAKIKIDYYYDAAKVNKVEMPSCYLNPGDELYYEVSADKSDSDRYEFSGFNISDYSEHTNKVLDWKSDEDGLVIKIPEDFSGTEIQISPIGNYGTRTLTLDDYYVDGFGKIQNINGSWIINSQLTQEDTYTIDSIRPYSVSYEYDSQRYYFLNASPLPIANSDLNGKVVFEITEPNKGVEAFKVQLGEYQTVNMIVNGNDKDIQGALKIQGEKEQILKKEMVLYKVKEGTEITITTKKNYDIKVNDVLLKPDVDGDHYIYRFVAGKNKYFTFDPSSYDFKHGKVVFMRNDHIITEKENLINGTTVMYHSENEDPGYYLPNGSFTVNGPETEKLIKAIRFYPKTTVNVKLKKEVVGGNIEYYIDGKKIYYDTVSILSGKTIQMHLIPWKGWNPTTKELDLIYKVGEEPNQTVSFMEEGKLISDDVLFVETDNRKPTLTVKVGESLKQKGILFDFTAPGIDPVINYEYNNGKNGIWDQFAINGKKIGTASPIKLRIHSEKYSLIEEAIKLIIQKKSGKDTITETRYITQLPSTVSVEVYSEYEISNPSRLIDNVEIKAELCNVVAHKEISLKHAKVIVTLATGERKTINNGDLIDPNEKVNVRIKADEGYFVSNTTAGTFVKNDISYSKYLNEVDNYINTHPIKQQISVLLADDEYGKCIYKRADGSIMTGFSKINEGEEITLEYTITNNSYQIKDQWLPSEKTNKTVKKKVEGNNTRVLDRSFFGIEVERKK